MKSNSDRTVVANATLPYRQRMELTRGRKIRIPVREMEPSNDKNGKGGKYY